MGKVRTIQSALNAGELSPKLHGRVDIPRYQHGLATCRNAIPMVWGGVQRINGTRYMGSAAGDIVRLVDFPITFDGVLSGYALEFGDNVLRFQINGQVIQDGPAAYQIATPYTAAELTALRYESSANVMYLFHPDHCPQRLTRNASDTDWTLEDLPFTSMPFLRPKGYDEITLKPSAKIGTITLTSNHDFFTADHVGLNFQVNNGICHVVSITDTTHAVATVLGGVDIPIKAVLRQDVLLLEFDGQTTTITIRADIIHNTLTVTPEDPLPDNLTFHKVSSSPTGYRQDIITVTYAPPLSSADFVTTITTLADFVNDTLDTTIDDPLPAGLTIDITTTVSNMKKTTPDLKWREQAWSDLRGWPACGTFFEQRLLLAGSRSYPTYQMGSHSADPLAFYVGTLDNQGFALNVAAISTTINHMVGLDTVTIFAGNKEITERGGADTPITPNNIQIKARTPHGSSTTRPVQIGADIYFVPASRLKLRGFVYQFSSDKYISEDVAVIADHLATLGGGFKEMAYTREPFNLLWIVTVNGVLLTLTLDKEQEVTAWAAHGDEQTRYISVAATPGTDGIERVTFAVQRLVSGVWHTYLEQLDNNLQTNSSASASGPALTELTGLNHLEGCLVDIKADGFYCGRKAVTGGKVALDYPASQIEAGLPYRTTIKDLPLELANPGQTAQETNIAVNKVHIRLHESQGCMVNGEQIPFRSFSNVTSPVQPFTGDKTVVVMGRGTDPAQTQVLIEQDLPFPLTVLAILKEVSING